MWTYCLRKLVFQRQKIPTSIKSSGTISHVKYLQFPNVSDVNFVPITFMINQFPENPTYIHVWGSFSKYTRSKWAESNACFRLACLWIIASVYFLIMFMSYRTFPRLKKYYLRKMGVGVFCKIGTMSTCKLRTKLKKNHSLFYSCILLIFIEMGIKTHSRWLNECRKFGLFIIEYQIRIYEYECGSIGLLKAIHFDLSLLKLSAVRE
jgi:hypothetical protein